MKYLYQGNTTKLPLLEEILADSGLAPDEIAYVGDDATDLPIMRRVGLAAAVAVTALIAAVVGSATPAAADTGHGDPEALRPRAARPDFDEACQLL